MTAITSFISDNRFNIFKTFLAYVTFFCLGSALNLLGSSLLDLQIRLAVDFAKVSYLLPFRSAGHILGSGSAGFLELRFNRCLVLSVCNLISGIFLGAAPNFFQFEYAACCLFIAGLAQGIIDVLCNTLIADTWKDKCTNWLQALHMSLGIGSLFTPVICRPFLIPEEGETSVQSALNETLESPIIELIDIKPTASDVQAQYAFMIIGVISVMISLPFGCIFLKERSNQSKNKNIVEASSDTKPEWSPLKANVGIFLVVVISHLLYSLEAVIGSLGASFSVKSDLHMDKKTGVLLATVFWTCFSFYRLIFIPLTFVVSEVKLLLLNILFMLLGVIICVLWGNTNQICIWIGFVFLGMGLSPIFSAAYGMLAKHITITGKIATLIIIPGVFGESAHPALAATLMAKNPITFLYYVGILGIILVVTFSLLIIYCKLVFKTPNGFQRNTNTRLSALSISRH
ncbi:major facilitator superfamily domain-containing protein 4B-like [Tetranychus urticae]|uniref:Major facilitator superfamily (MFS) profile domain-containing protein n=1 Tax=Tetranychus urticae TaxID=32264 RepID=T1JSG4_TETUR|nr:major facilitator superfamily domain-containing protein 4B-like [Tetranychus urticae]